MKFITWIYPDMMLLLESANTKPVLVKLITSFCITLRNCCENFNTRLHVQILASSTYNSKVSHKVLFQGHKDTQQYVHSSLLGLRSATKHRKSQNAIEKKWHKINKLWLPITNLLHTKKVMGNKVRNYYNIYTCAQIKQQKRRVSTAY